MFSPQGGGGSVTLTEGSNVIGFISPRVAQAMQNGDFYIATSARLEIASGDAMNLLVKNPAGSGVNMILAELAVHSSNSSMGVSQLFRNPTTNIPTTQRTPLNANQADQTAAQGQFLAEDMASVMEAGDGDALDAHLAVHEGENRLRLDMGFLIPPGVSMGIGQGTGALGSFDAMASAHWFEVEA